MAEKVKVDIKKQNGQQDNSKPYVYTFRPVHLETSVDVVQKYNHYSSAQQHFRAQDEKEAKKAKCPVKKTLNSLFIITLLIVVALICGYIAFDPLTKFINDRIYVYSTFPLVNWLKGDYVLLFGSFGIAVALISIVIRWILHPFGCKVKKNRHCCPTCEFIKFIWTGMFVGIVLSAIFASKQILGFDQVYLRSVAVINEFISSGFSIAYLSTLKPEHLLPFICIVLSIVVFIVLVVITFKHSIKDKNNVFLDNNYANQYVPQNNMNGGQNQGMYNGNYPYNNDRVYYAPTKRSSFAGKIFKVLAVIIVITLVYCVAAYFVEGLPLHNIIRNLL